MLVQSDAFAFCVSRRVPHSTAVKLALPPIGAQLRFLLYFSDAFSDAAWLVAWGAARARDLLRPSQTALRRLAW